MSPGEGPTPSPLMCTRVTAGYSAVPIVREISLNVEPGEIVTMIGPNGSGKSTFLKAVAGHLQLQSGEIELGETPLSRLAPERRAALGLAYVPQNDDVFAALTVQENLAVGGYLMSRKLRHESVSRVMRALPQLTALRRRRAVHLSGGERKLTALGRALVPNPRMLLLDEPTAGLAEPVANALLRETVKQLRASGVGILLVEQRARLALEVADRAYVLVSGAVQHTASASSLLEGDLFAKMFFKTSVGGKEDLSPGGSYRQSITTGAQTKLTESLENDRT
jgi:ABC-type branched-subunit amino acid transport system ATPase component